MLANEEIYRKSMEGVKRTLTDYQGFPTDDVNKKNLNYTENVFVHQILVKKQTFR